MEITGMIIICISMMVAFLVGKTYGSLKVEYKIIELQNKLLEIEKDQENFDKYRNPGDKYLTYKPIRNEK